MVGWLVGWLVGRLVGWMEEGGEGEGGGGGEEDVCRDSRWTASLGSPATWLPLSPGAGSSFGYGLGEELHLSELCPTGGGVVAVCVVLHVAQCVFCWL